MTEYTISDMNGTLYVADSDGKTCGGPYKNEESAKRRIRDLKRKDKEQTEIVADMQATEMMPTAPESKIGDVLNIHVPDPATINSDNVVEHALVDASTNYRQSPDVRKLAASSEYGNFKLDPVAFAAELETSTVIHPSLTNGRTRQVGCYPAISKHAYQR